MIKKLSVFRPPSFYLLCLILIFSPLFRGSVHMWAKTLIQMLTILAVMGLVLKSKGCQCRKRLPFEMKDIYFSFWGPVFCLIFLSSFFTQQAGLTFEAAGMLITYVSIFFVVGQVAQDFKTQKTLFYVVIGIGLFMSVFGMLKRFDMNFLGLWEYPDIHWPGYTSLTGPYVNRNHMAGFLDMAIPLVVSLFWVRERSPEEKFGLWWVLVLFMTTLAMTLSRGGWIATGAGLLFFFGVLGIIQKRKMGGYLLGITAAVFIAVILLMNTPVVQRITTLTQGEMADSLTERMRTWRGTIDIIKDYPAFGTGPGTFALVYPKYQVPGKPVLELYAHNDYLQFISETGVGFVAVLIWMIFMFYRAGFRKMKKRCRQTRAVTLGAMAGVTAMLVHSFFDFNLHIPANAVLFTVLGALVLCPEKLRKV